MFSGRGNPLGKSITWRGPPETKREIHCPMEEKRLKEGKKVARRLNQWGKTPEKKSLAVGGTGHWGTPQPALGKIRVPNMGGGTMQKRSTSQASSGRGWSGGRGLPGRGRRKCIRSLGEKEKDFERGGGEPLL